MLRSPIPFNQELRQPDFILLSTEFSDVSGHPQHNGLDSSRAIFPGLPPHRFLRPASQRAFAHGELSGGVTIVSPKARCHDQLAASEDRTLENFLRNFETEASLLRISSGKLPAFKRSPGPGSNLLADPLHFSIPPQPQRTPVLSKLIQTQRSQSLTHAFY
jgi:hypothetical protein